MIAIGNVLEPRSSDIPCYAERWLADGQAYEYTITKTPSPPPDLISQFQEIVGTIGVLGLYYSGNSETGLKLEWTVGRANVTKVVTEPPEERTLETAWIPNSTSPVQMECVIYCDTRTTRNGGYHKNTKSHIQSKQSRRCAHQL